MYERENEMLTIFKRKPVAELLVVKEEPDAFAQEYDELATKLGVVARATTSDKLAKVLASLQIPCYKLEDVEKYMDKKGYWSWFELRHDQPSLNVVRKTPTQWRTLYGNTVFRTYDKPIPYPVLLTIDQIQAELGAQAVFFIAALNDKPDPFLGVMLWSDTSQFFVVERWDEPGFRGSKEGHRRAG